MGIARFEIYREWDNDVSIFADNDHMLNWFGDYRLDQSSLEHDTLGSFIHEVGVETLRMFIR